MKYAIAFLLIVSGTPCFSQLIVKGTVLDSATKKPVPYSLITTNSGKTGTIANANGEFAMTLPDSLRDNYLAVSCLGFDTATLSIDRFISSPPGNIYLHHKIVVMPEVSITSTGNDTLCKANWGATRKAVLFEGNVFWGAGWEMAVYISNPKGDSGIISKLKFYIQDRGFPQTSFRAKLYYVNKKDKSPDNIMLDQELILNASKGNEWATIDISAYNIPIPADGFFVSMEWLPAATTNAYTETIHKHEFSGQGQVLGESKEIKTSVTWARPFLGKWMFLEQKEKPVVNAMIGAEVMKKCK
jgi:hypothetical protein